MQEILEIIESLNSIGYQNDGLQTPAFEEILEDGINSKDFRFLIFWLTNELGILLSLDEQIHPESESTEFIIELSSMLKELCCPYSALISGSTGERFQSKQDRLLLVSYLLNELMAAKMSHKLNPHKKFVIEILESPPAVALKSITQNLNLGKPPQNITPRAFFEKLLNQFSELCKKNELLCGKALFVPSRALTFEEWIKLEKLQNELDTEYDLRREMLITRLDVTIQSFQWSDAAKNKISIISECYSNKRQHIDTILHHNKATDIVELLAARNELLYVEKTSSANVRKNTQTDLQKHIIGMVPDRGGRANEHQPPSPEMPAWQNNRSQGGHGNQGGGSRPGANRHFNYKGQHPQQQRNYHDQGSQGSYQNSGNYYGNNYKQQNSGSSDSSNYNHSRNGSNNRVQGGWSQSGGGNRSNENFRNYGQNQQGNDNYYGPGGNIASGSYRSNFNTQHSNPDFNRRSDGHNRGQSNYNRGGRR